MRVFLTGLVYFWARIVWYILHSLQETELKSLSNSRGVNICILRLAAARFVSWESWFMQRTNSLCSYLPDTHSLVAIIAQMNSRCREEWKLRKDFLESKEENGAAHFSLVQRCRGTTAALLIIY